VGDIAGMAKNAIHILEDDARLANFKENALKRAKEFELSLILPMYVDFYTEVIAQSKVAVLSK
jgi:hypothetical protein